MFLQFSLFIYWILDQSTKIWMFAFFLHYYPKLFIQKKVFWLRLIFWHSWSKHWDSCLIFYLRSFFINFQFDSLIHIFKGVTLKILIFYFLTWKLAKLPLNIEINTWHLELIDIFYLTDHFVLIKVDSLNGMITILNLLVLDEINQVTFFLAIYTDHKLIWIFVISVSYLTFLFLIFGIEWLNLLAIKLKSLLLWFFERSFKFNIFHQVCIDDHFHLT